MVAFDSGELLPVLPEHYLRVGAAHEEEQLVGHILAFPYREPTEQELRQPQLQLLPNRILVYRYSEAEGYNSMTLYEYNGGTVIGREIMTGPAGITGILAAGDNDSFYPM